VTTYYNEMTNPISRWRYSTCILGIPYIHIELTWFPSLRTGITTWDQEYCPF